jgi:hypothetical protein
LTFHLTLRLRAGALAAALAVASVFLLAEAAHGDSRQSGLIDGRVVDAAGAALAGINVRLVGDRGVETRVTDQDGRFVFGALGAGDYVAAIELLGSASTERAVRLETGERRTLDFRLDLATEERIEVHATAPLIDPHQSGVVSTMDGEVIGDLVFTSRNFQSVLASLPGVAHRANSLAEATPHVNGGLWQESSVFIDGVDVTDSRFGGGARMPLPASAFSEVRSVASGYASEYGRAVGGVTETVTRSGTNQFHGDLLWVAQNPSWRADSEVVSLEREDDLISSYESSLGGPIARDRAWFFIAAGDTTTNTVAPLVSGEAIDSSLEAEAIIGKLDAEVSDRHHLAVTAIDGLARSPLFMASTAELSAVASAERDNTFVTAAWSWTAAADRFVEVRGARQRASSNREKFASTPIEPGASPDDPAGNDGAYWDNTTGLHWHGSDLPLGPGTLEFPRDQGNASFTWLWRRHEIGAGADYQDIGWEALNRPPPRYFGSGYDPSAAGGFARPEFKRVFIPIESPVGTRSTNGAVFAQDRVDLTERWSISLGVRLEDQAHEDDRGREVIGSTDLVPRAAMVYDVGGEGRLLIKATGGRYVTQIPQDFLNQEFSSLPNGANAFDEFLWNPGTQRYDRFNRRQLPALRATIEDVEPYLEDELTAGIDWQVNPVWGVDARVIAWRIEEPWSATNQFDERGAIYRLLAGFPQAEREYRGLQIEANRAFRDGFFVRANYTLSRVEGNSVGSSGGGDDFLEAMAVLDPVAGVPVTAVNRHGRLSHDRTHILNLAGVKRFTAGAHRLSLGGWLAFRSGEPWGLRESVALRASPASATIFTTRYIEPRDRHQMPDTYTLDLTAAWEMPIASRVAASVRVELVNATDEQEQIAVSDETGEPVPVPQSYQTPREVRLVAGVRF